MSIVGVIRAYWQRVEKWRIYRQLRKSPALFNIERANWDYSLQHPTEFYLECVRRFEQSLPQEIKEHRTYFNRRGFGEDAFHVMWEMLVGEFKPTNFLEIGVFRGQTLSLVSYFSQLNDHKCDVCGISPFSSVGDSVSTYQNDVDYLQDTLQNFNHFHLAAPQLLRAYSTDPEAKQFIASKKWGLIYIDGNHDYEIARQDWEICSRNLTMGGVVVLDDSGLTTAFRPPVFATGGHPGPSKLAQEIDRKQFREILQVGHNRVFQRIA